MTRRLAAVLLAASAALGVVAAPAPVYRPDPTRWLGMGGWEKPQGLRGECTPGRDGGSLTFSLVAPAGTRSPDREKRCSLLREVEGDFVLEVRVSGDLRPLGEVGFHRAGVTLLGGATSIEIGRATILGDDRERVLFRAVQPGGSTLTAYTGPSKGRPTRLRLSRRSGKVLVEFAEDGTGWEVAHGGEMAVDLPRRVKVGVMIEATAPGSLRATFDQFKLTRPRK